MNTGKYFLAIDIPKDIAEDIYKKVKAIFEKHKIEYLDKELYHITIYYIGFNYEKEAIDYLKKIPKIGPFKVKLKGVNNFRSRIIFIYAHSDELKQIMSIFTENQIPHLTLAKKEKLEKYRLHNLIKDLSNLNLNYNFIVDKIILYQTLFLNKKRKYVKIAEVNI